MGKVTVVTSQTGAYKLRQFTEPITRHVISTVQKLIKGMQRMGLNRHRRGYLTAEAATGVHFSMPGPIRARPVSYFKYHDSIIIFLIIITSCISKKKIRSYFITTDTTALSIAYGPILIIRGNSRNSVINSYHMHLVVE